MLYPAIDDLYSAWSAAFERRDIDAVLSLLTPDYVLCAPSMPEITAIELRPRFEAAFAAYAIHPTFECVQRTVVGDIAIDRGWDTQRLLPLSGAEPITIRQRVLLVLSRSTDGVWRFAQGMTQPGPGK